MTVAREDLENSVRHFALALREVIQRNYGHQVGFALILFDFHDNGAIAYASNAQRTGMIRTLTDTITLLREDDAKAGKPGGGG